MSRDFQSTSQEKRPLRCQPEDHNFGSLIMLAVRAGGHEDASLLSSAASAPLKTTGKGMSNAPAQRIDANDPDLASRFAVTNMSLQLRLLRS